MWPHVREWMLRLRGLFRGQKQQFDRDFEDELAFHVAMREEKHAGSGLEASTAKRKARHELGGIEKWKEALRDVSRPRALENFASDVKLGVRLLRKSPTFTVVALATLTIAIGANTAVFSLLNTLMLRPLPVPQADRLVLWRVQPGDYGYSFNYPLYRSLETKCPVFSGVFAFAGHSFQMRGSDGTEMIPGVMVNGQYFSTLRVPPEKGRWIDPSDDQLGGGPGGAVAVVSDKFWKTKFNRNPAIIGRKITLDHVAFTVVGVMPSTFHGADVGKRPDLFVPLTLEPMVDAPYNNIAMGWQARWISVGARLRDGVSLQQANAFLRVSSRAAVASAPNPNFGLNGIKVSKLYVTAEGGATGFSYVRLQFRNPLLVVMGLVALVLFVACLNLASLLMARSAGRERELATRFALGAARGRLLQQLLTESLLLAAAGTALGFLVSLLVGRLLVSFLTSPGQGALQFDVTPDGRVFAFGAVVAALTALLIGIVPALRSTGRNLQDRFKEGSISLRGAERRRLWPRILMTSEIALALVLVTGAGLLGYSLVQLRSTSIGFNPAGLTLLSLEMIKQPRDGQALLRFYEEYAEQLERLRGVDSVSYVNFAPISGSTGGGAIRRPGRAVHLMFWNQVSPRYFATMMTPLLSGREFSWTDTDGSPRKTILNKSAARILFPQRDSIGQHVLIDDSKSAEVVEIVADAKYENLRDPAPPTYCTPITQNLGPKASLDAILRSAGKPGPLVAAVRSILRRLAPDVPAPVATSMEQQITDSLAAARFMALLASFFAAMASLITAVGLYGTLAYSTARRTGEIGIRMALGAQRGNILRLILKENVLIVVCGCALGLLVSIVCTHYIGSFLYQVRSNSPAVLITSSGVLLLVGLLASLIPAMRASRIDPMAAIRHE